MSTARRDGSSNDAARPAAVARTDAELDAAYQPRGEWFSVSHAGLRAVYDLGRADASAGFMYWHERAFNAEAQRDRVLDAHAEGAWMARALDAEREAAELRAELVAWRERARHSDTAATELRAELATLRAQQAGRL